MSKNLPHNILRGILILLPITVARAQIATTSVGNPATQAVSPAGAIGNFYLLALGISGLLAFGMIVLGAAKYTLAAGNPSGQSDARDTIFQALLGLLLLLGAYLVLNTISPNLTNFQLISIKPLPQVPASQSNVSQQPQQGFSQPQTPGTGNQPCVNTPCITAPQPCINTPCITTPQNQQSQSSTPPTLPQTSIPPGF